MIAYVSLTVNHPTQIFLRAELLSLLVNITTHIKVTNRFLYIRSRCEQIFRPTIYKFPYFDVILICIDVLI